jgi:hypothetical protein
MALHVAERADVTGGLARHAAIEARPAHQRKAPPGWKNSGASQARTGAPLGVKKPALCLSGHYGSMPKKEPRRVRRGGGGANVPIIAP